MSDTEHTCRICRVEATPTQPLIHPCQCRGSIKYIHQECLLEWLEHSNNKAKRCDICNTPYRFVTLYDPEMPKTMPAREIFRKLLVSAHDSVIKHISAALYLICVCQIPIYWKFVGRLCTYAVDGKMPSPSFSLLHVMAYGAYSRTRNGHLFSSPEATAAEKLWTFFYNTFLSGTLQVVAFVVVLFVIFIEHEWVVREEGYTKSLLRHIGKEPKTKLADLLGSMLANRRESVGENGPENGTQTGAENGPASDENSEVRDSVATRALEYIQQDAHAPFPGTNLREALDNGQFDELFQGLLEREAPNEEADETHAASPGSRDFDNMAQNHNPPDLYADDEDDEDMGRLYDNIADHDVHVRAVADDLHVRDGHRALELDDSEDETPEELERRRNIEEDEMAVAEAANNNGNIFEIMGLRLSLATPIQLMFLVDSAALLLLFLVYFLPHILGSFVALVLSYVLMGVHGVFLAPVLAFLPVKNVQNLVLQVASKYASLPYMAPLCTIVSQHLVAPVVKVVMDVTALDRTEPPNYVARFVFLAIGYSVVCFAINQLMTALILGRNPVRGTSRRMYKVLFQITATAKVFAIFAIEIMLFPIYCGWLLDFCLAPLLIADLTRPSDAGTVYQIFFTSAHALTQKVLIRFVLYWMWGTGYMFCIALFVSMTRNHILRPGVLYFIKSPEDPNARLIHDAVVKPFFLQMSRILLSAKVYSAFVVLGIGSVTWGIRLLVNPPGTKGALLPIRQFSYFSFSFAFITAVIFFKAEPVITKYCRLFWKRSFAVLCHKLRLSHFILGSPVPQERGHVVYRSALDSFLKLGQPDYSRPVSYSEAMQIFKDDPAITACFVPNGSYIRAPSSDDNSRRFLRELFVPVTKSDQLLAPSRETYEDDTDWWDADVICEDTYTVVYSPPNMRLRCLALVCMISVFGALIFVVLSTIALLVGRPIFRAWVIATEFAATVLGAEVKLSESFDWSLADVDSLCVGLLAQLVLLLLLDSGPEGSAMVNFAAEQRRRWAEPAENFRAFMGRSALISVQVWFFWEMHLSYVLHMEAQLFGTSVVSIAQDQFTFEFTWAGFVMHSLMALLTVLPIFTTLFSGMPELDGVRAWVWKAGLDKLAASMAIILVHKAYASIYGLDAQMEMYARYAVVAAILLARGILTARTILHGITEQIKMEKYVRGTAVQNVDVADD